MAAALFLLMAAFTITKTARDALFFQAGGLLELPKAYVAIAIGSVPTAFGMLALMRAIGPRPARVVAPLLMAAFLIVYAFLARPGGGGSMTAAYVIVPLVFGVLFSQAWLLGADLLDGAPRETLANSYAWIGAASIAGGVAGGAVAKLASAWVDPPALLTGAAALLVGAAATAGRTQRRFSLRRSAAAPGSTAPGAGDFAKVVRERYSLLLLGVAMAASLVGILVEFQFYIAASAAGAGTRANADFFASFYLGLNAIALLGQLVIMPQLQRRLGVHGSLLVLPFALLGLAGALLVNATVLTRAIVRVAEGGLKSSIHRVSWEQAYLPLDRAQRAAAKLFVDGMGARLAEGLAAGVIFLWIRAAMPDGEIVATRLGWMTWALLGAVVLWLGLTGALRASLAPATTSARLEGEERHAVPLPDS